MTYMNLYSQDTAEYLKRNCQYRMSIPGDGHEGTHFVLDMSHVAHSTKLLFLYLSSKITEVTMRQYWKLRNI